MLVIDDDPDLRLIIQKLIEGDGHRVHTVSDGAAALEFCASDVPQLIIADLMLPKMDGEEFLRRFKNQFPDQDVPVILVSASAIRQEVAKRTNVAASLPKPFDGDELLELVRKYLGTAPR